MTTEPTCAYNWNQYESLQRSKMQRKENKSAPSCHHRHNMSCSPPTRCVSFLCVCTFFLCMSVCICVSFFDTYNINSNLGFDGTIDWWKRVTQSSMRSWLCLVLDPHNENKQTNKNNCTNLAGFFFVFLPPGNMAPIKRWRKHTIQ